MTTTSAADACRKTATHNIIAKANIVIIIIVIKIKIMIIILVITKIIVIIIIIVNNIIKKKININYIKQ